MRELKSGWDFPARAVIALVAALGAVAALGGPAAAVTRPAGRPESHASPAAPTFRQSHLWTFGNGSVLGSRPQTPQPIHGLPAGQHVVGAIATYDYHPFFLLGNGTVWILRGHRPAEVPGLSGITAISAVGTTRYALSRTGAVYSWTALGRPSQVPGVAGVISVVNGYALESDGTVWALGGASPVQVNVPATVTQISSNACGGASYALTTAGTIYAWGANNYGQLGDGTFTDSATPVLVRRVTDAARVIGGCNDAYAILKGIGTVMAWGQGSQGELGNGHRYVSPQPVAVSNLSGITSVTPGYRTTYAVRKDGTVWDWGFGRTDQLAYQASGYSALPGQVIGLGAPIAYVVASTTSYSETNYAVAVGRDGTLWGPWGGPSDSPYHQITRVPLFKPATGFWLNPFGGVTWGYAGANYIAN